MGALAHCARCDRVAPIKGFRPPFCMACSLSFIETEAALRYFYNLDAMGAHIDYVTRRSVLVDSPAGGALGDEWRGWELEGLGIVSDGGVDGFINVPGQDRDGRERTFSTAEARFYPPAPSLLVGQVLWRPWEAPERRRAVNIRNDQADGPAELTKADREYSDQVYTMAALREKPSQGGRYALEELRDDESPWRRYARLSLDLRLKEPHLNAEQRYFKVNPPVSPRQLRRWETRLLNEGRKVE